MCVFVCVVTKTNVCIRVAMQARFKKHAFGMQETCTEWPYIRVSVLDTFLGGLHVAASMQLPFPVPGPNLKLSSVPESLHKVNLNAAESFGIGQVAG